MAEGRSKLILVSVALAESVWIFALLSVIGLVVDLGGSPLPWLSLLALMGVSIVSGYLLGGAEGDEIATAMRQSAFGVVVIYLILGTGTFLHDTAFDPAWIFRIFAGELESSEIAAAVVALIVSVWMWRHGLRLGTDRYPEDRLARIFRIGIVVLAVTVLVDEARPEDLNSGTLLVPFFGATLVGLAVGRLPEAGVGNKTGEWARIIALSVFGIMGLGLLIGLIGGLYGSGGTQLLYAGWGLFVDGFLWVLRFPITWITEFLHWLLNLLTGGDGVPPRDPIEQPPPGPQVPVNEPNQANSTGNSTVDTILNILQYPAIAMIIIAVFFVLAMAFRRFGNRSADDDGDERESIRGELNTDGDMSRLLSGLVPGWLRRKKGHDWRYPDDPGFAEVFKLYFESIRLGVKWGMEFRPQMTPAERLPLLEAALPGAPVQEVTSRFNAACYGRRPTDPATVEELRVRLKSAEDALRKS